MAVLVLCMMCWLGGCGWQSAGTTADLLTYDVIALAAGESAKGVEALNQTVVADTAKRQDAMLADLEKSVVIAATSAGDKPVSREDAAALAARITVAMRQHLANYAEQDRRREDLYRATMDNLLFIAETTERAKQFTIYRADIGEQWRAYLEAATKARLRVNEGAPAITQAGPAP